MLVFFLIQFEATGAKFFWCVRMCGLCAQPAGCRGLAGLAHGRPLTLDRRAHAACTRAPTSPPAQPNPMHSTMILCPQPPRVCLRRRFLLYMFLTLCAFSFYGMGITNLMPTVVFATSNGGLFILLWMLFCGFLVYRDNIKPWWIWCVAV